MRSLLHTLFWVFTVLGFTIISPLFVFLVVILFLTQGRPIFFLQKRVGFKGEFFNIIKFRTMIIGADKIGDGLWGGGENDNRYTKLGSFLRKTKLDELPQLLNVIKTDMNLVGPRPQVAFIFNKYEDLYQYTTIVKPGITGPTQVGGGNNLTRYQRIKLDIKYVNNLAWWRDVLVLFGTVFVILFPTQNKIEFSEENIEDIDEAKFTELKKMMLIRGKK